MSAAAWWDPHPRLPSAHPALLPEGVRQLRTTLYGEGVPHSAFELPGLPTGPGGPLAALRGAVRRADLDAALRTATRLIGMGPGLTPAGDDVMAGTVAGLEPHGDGVRVQVGGVPDGGTTVLAEVTAAAVAELDLRPGVPVWVAVKASDVAVYPGGG